MVVSINSIICILYNIWYTILYNLEEGPPKGICRKSINFGAIFLNFGALKSSRSDQIRSLQRQFVPSLPIMHRLELTWDALGAQELIPGSSDVCHCLHFGASWAPKPGQVSLPKPFCIEIRRCAQYPIISYTEATSAGFELSIKSCRNQC